MVDWQMGRARSRDTQYRNDGEREQGRDEFSLGPSRQIMTSGLGIASPLSEAIVRAADACFENLVEGRYSDGLRQVRSFFNRAERKESVQFQPTISENPTGEEGRRYARTIPHISYRQLLPGPSIASRFDANNRASTCPSRL